METDGKSSKQSGKQVTQIIQKTTCTFFCCFRVKSPQSKKKVQAKIILKERKKSNRNSRLKNLPKMKVSDMSQPMCKDKKELVNKIPLPEKKQSELSMNQASESCLLPIQCSTPNVFSFKSKDSKMDQDLNMKAFQKFLMPSESRNSMENSSKNESDRVKDITTFHEGENLNVKKEADESKPSEIAEDSHLPKIKNNPELPSHDAQNLINDAEDCIRKLDDLFERQAKSFLEDDSVSAITKSKSDCEPRKVIRRKARGKKKVKRGKKAKKQGVSKNKAEPCYNIDFWKNKVFSAERRSDCSEYYKENCEKNKPGLMYNNENEDMYDDLAIKY
ncbi:unnamed protein product [Moneuplotes crassus]|uniref:Uncharacterized protein n=1 Tax=Euplotes crassus TaxID=5936 RepID=A0AAD1XA29_EUPCR|nr:unnamed protein product [Moneuplotes crassus]